MQKLKIELYQGVNDQWFWRMKRSGRTMAESYQSYRTWKDAMRSIDSLLKALHSFQYEFAHVPRPGEQPINVRGMK